jgi:hypothetical protein
MNTQITDFVHEALKQGVSREDIGRGLLEGGWSQKEIRAALDAFVESDLPLPVPRKRVSGTAKEAFLFLMFFSAMYTALFALGSVLFDLINLQLPDPGEPAYRWISSLRYGMATVAVSFPIFLFMRRVIGKEAEQNPGQRISPVRRWLTYLTLFIASASLVTDMITLVVRFLSGDLTLRFGLKVTVVGVMAAIVLLHFLRDLRRDEMSPSSETGRIGAGRLPMAALIALVLVVLSAGFWIAGSPARARLYSQDLDRLRDLENITRRVQLYYRNQGSLPDSLDACDISPETYIERKQDRITGKAYEYRVMDETHFELGADFAASYRPDDLKGTATAYPGYGVVSPGFWQHGAGRATFVIDVTKKDLR